MDLAQIPAQEFFSNLVSNFGPVMENLRQREYHRSEFSLQQLRFLNPTSASATGVAIRYKTDGQEMERVGLPTCCIKEIAAGSLL